MSEFFFCRMFFVKLCCCLQTPDSADREPSEKVKLTTAQKPPQGASGALLDCLRWLAALAELAGWTGWLNWLAGLDWTFPIRNVRHNWIF